MGRVNSSHFLLFLILYQPTCMKKNLNLILRAFCLMPLFVSCNEDNSPEKTSISFDPAIVQFAIDATSDTVKVNMNGTSWEVSSNQTWCSVSKRVSTHQSDSLVVSVSTNTASTPRTALLIFSVNNGKLIDTLFVNQVYKNFNYPDYSDSIPGNMTGVTSTAKELASKMYAGLNIGNTLEVPGGETGWGNPMITQLLIDSIKAAGFNTVRLPCAWYSHLVDGATCRIDPNWLARVKEVIDYCYKNNMYVILNIHWDGGWLENNPTYLKQPEVNAMQKAFWEQIAMYFRDYDEHLLFAGTNEVNASWATPKSENIQVQQSYVQTFLTAVRSTGGKNAYRNLVVQSYSCNISYAKTYNKLPYDNVANRLFVEVHFYDPYQFCFNTGSGANYYWGSTYAAIGVTNWGQEDWVRSEFGIMKTNFVNKGYPVILGEYGAIQRLSLTGITLTNHLKSRAYYLNYVTKTAKSNGMVPCYWDNGVNDNGFALFTRSTGAAFDRQAVNAIMEGAAHGVYPY